MLYNLIAVDLSRKTTKFEIWLLWSANERDLLSNKSMSTTSLDVPILNLIVYHVSMGLISRYVSSGLHQLKMLFTSPFQKRPYASQRGQADYHFIYKLVIEMRQGYVIAYMSRDQA